MNDCFGEGGWRDRNYETVIYEPPVVPATSLHFHGGWR